MYCCFRLTKYNIPICKTCNKYERAKLIKLSTNNNYYDKDIPLNYAPIFNSFNLLESESRISKKESGKNRKGLCLY